MPADTPAQEGVEEEIVASRLGRGPRRGPVEELAMAMGSVVEHAAATDPPAEPTVDEDAVGELAMAMGAVFERAGDERPTIEPAVDADTTAQEAGMPECALIETAVAGRDLAENAADERAGGRAAWNAAALELLDYEPAVSEPRAAEPSDAEPEPVESLDEMVVAVVGLRGAGLPRRDRAARRRRKGHRHRALSEPHRRHSTRQSGADELPARGDPPPPGRWPIRADRAK